jgi:hypothetical protein
MAWDYYALGRFAMACDGKNWTYQCSSRVAEFSSVRFLTRTSKVGCRRVDTQTNTMPASGSGHLTVGKTTEEQNTIKESLGNV